MLNKSKLDHAQKEKESLESELKTKLKQMVDS